MKTKLLKVFTIIFLFAFFSNSLFAQEEENYSEKTLSITFSPFHLLNEKIKIFEAMIEKNINQDISVALIGGAGTAEIESDGDNYDATVYELGGQLKYYFKNNSKHKLNFGLELLWLDIDVSSKTTSETATGTGLSVGPFFGYKYVADGGFTFDFQLGYAKIVAHAESENDEESAETNAPILNLNFGWSF